MVTLLLYQNDWPQAAEVVSRSKLTPEQFTEAQQRAEKLKAPTHAKATPGDRVAAFIDPLPPTLE
jgi:hypothetical protein